MIRCEGVSFTYPDGTRALDAIDLAIEPGERVAITGPNGSGKSTLVRLWNGLLRPTAGRVLIDGRSTHGRRVAELSRIVGLTFQDPTRQLFRATCRAEVAFGAWNVHSGNAVATDRAIDEALGEVGLGERGQANPFDLGPSKRRLLTVACVLAMQPRVIVLDEPTMGLDAAEIAALETVVRSGRRPFDQIVVAISHDARFVAENFGRAIRLDAGRVVADGTPEEIFGAG